MIAPLSKDIGLRPAQWRAIVRKAKHAGKTAPEYIRSLIEQGLLAEKSFDEILRPIRHDFRKSGITAGKLDRVVQRARRAGHPKAGKAHQ